MASEVEFEPVPAMTGTRPRAASMTSSTTRLCSSWLRVGDSPVVPQGTMPSVPLADVQLDQLPELGLVHLAAAERGDERDDRALECRGA